MCTKWLSGTSGLLMQDADPHGAQAASMQQVGRQHRVERDLG